MAITKAPASAPKRRAATSACRATPRRRSAASGPEGLPPRPNQRGNRTASAGGSPASPLVASSAKRTGSEIHSTRSTVVGWCAGVVGSRGMGAASNMPASVASNAVGAFCASFAFDTKLPGIRATAAGVQRRPGMATNCVRPRHACLGRGRSGAQPRQCPDSSYTRPGRLNDRWRAPLGRRSRIAVDFKGGRKWIELDLPCGRQDEVLTGL